MTRLRSPIAGLRYRARCAALPILMSLGMLFTAGLTVGAQTSSPDSSVTRHTDVYAPGKIPPYRFRLIGVFDETTGAPLDSVHVTDVLTGASMLTSRTGTTTLIFLPDGGSIVRLQKIGYQTKNLTVAIGPADTAPVTEMMTRLAILSTVTVRDSAQPYVSPLLRDFEQRKRSGNGHFIDESEMRKHENETMSKMLTSLLPGLMPAHGRAAEYVVSSRTMCAGPALTACRTPNCYPEVYVDGVRYTETGTAARDAVDFSKWSPTTFAAAEFYTSLEVPPELASAQAKCGVLLFWTRER